MKTKRKTIVLRIILALFLLFVAYFGYGIVRSFYLESRGIQVAVRSTTGVTGTVRIAQLSDLHRAVYGPENQELVDLVASKSPDLIVATGDMIDVHTEAIEPTIDLFRRMVETAPVYYSLGNHEMDHEKLIELWVGLEAIGVHVVQNEIETAHVNGMDIQIAGIYYADQLYRLSQMDNIDILLSHFPHKLDDYAANGIPLTFSGHTHGGQFRLPFLDVALYAPNQGWFPQYTTGLYEQDGSYMIVSRGLGNSTFPFRVHNPPEVIIADVTFTNQIIRTDAK